VNRVYYGKVGGGKTHCVMFQEIIPALRAGRKVVTNIDGLNVRELRNYIGKDIDITVRGSISWWQKTLTCEIIDDGHDGKAVLNPDMFPDALYVIDEAQFIWDARQFKDTKSGFLHLLEYNRHLGVDLVFITQNVKRCDVNISRLANDSYQIKNIGFLHSFAKNRYVVNRRQTPFDKDVIAQYSHKYNPAIFTLFQSGANSNSVKQKSKFSAYFVMPVVLLFIFCVVMLIKQGNPIAAISKSTIKKGVNNVNNSVDIFGLPHVTSRQVSDQTGNEIQESASGEDAEPIKIKEVKKYSLEYLQNECYKIGYVSNGSIMLVHYDCEFSTVVVRNGVVQDIFRKEAH